ncbi:hypothetical protein JCM11641_003450 [Rhodosporidiobolus odoratus]
MSSSPFSPRALSLAAVCIQSTALAIVLHVSQAHLAPGQAQYKASSAVLITELGKLVLSLLLALRDTIKEQATLFAPRHKLPSPELYASGAAASEKDLYRDDPYDTTPPPSAPLLQPNHLRRRSSVARNSTFSITLEMDDPSASGVTRFPESSSLASFKWPHKPISGQVTEKLRKISPDGVAPADPKVLKLLDDPRLWLRRRRLGVVRMLWEDIFGGDWWRMAVPAVLFALQNNLIYIAARNLSVPVFQITFQLKTLITAVCAVLMLGRRLALVQWLALVTLGLGVATMQLGAIHAKANDSHGHGSHPATESESMNYVAGVSAVLISCFSSAIAATYFELVIKRKPVVPPVEEFMLVAPPTIKPASLWVRNIQLSFFSSIIGLCVVLFQANDVHFHGLSGLSLDFKGMVDPLEHWYDPVVKAGEGFFEGFHPMAWAVIFLQTVGGLLIAVAIKHADNVAKGFALSISIVFTFLLSVILFDFQLSASSIIGGATVVSSTLLFEMAPKDIRQLFIADRYSGGKPILRRWHYILLVVLATVFGAALFPTKHLSVTTAAWDLMSESMEQHPVRLPTVAVADLSHINIPFDAAAGPGVCGWGVRTLRGTTKEPYGSSHPVSSDYPYWVTNTDQYALDDILTTRLQTYTKSVPLLSTPSPDFIYLPVLSQIWANPWGCNAPELLDGIRRTTQYMRDLAASVGQTRYPRIVVPIATIRSNLEREVFTPEIMEELKDSVVLVSIENAPKTHKEGMKYLIDVPYPTAFHLSASPLGTKPSLGDQFLHAERPYLLHYAAAASHPWGLPASDPFNGFALRASLYKQFSDYVASPPPDATSRIVFDDITNSFDGAQNLTMFHEHMSQATFCPQPAGDSPSRRAFYESLLLGCIPVIFRERSYGRLFPSSPEINELSRYTVHIDENDMINNHGPSLVQRLEAISPVEIRRMQKHIRRIAPKLQWALPEEEQWFPQPGQDLPAGTPIFNLTQAKEQEIRLGPSQPDAFSTLLKELAAIRDGEWVPGVARDLRKGMQKFGRPLR